MMIKGLSQPMPFYDSMIFLTQIQVLAHGLVELHEVHMGPLLSFVKFTLKLVNVPWPICCSLLFFL